MKFLIERLTKEDWKIMAKNAILISFAELTNPEEERIDYALMVIDHENSTPAGFMTVIEMDAKTAYLQRGGVFPDHAKSVYVYNQYKACLDELKNKYDTLWTRIENKNYSMLKMALKAGFIVNGTYNQDGKLFLEMILEK